jgi:hypothetical protein
MLIFTQTRHDVLWAKIPYISCSSWNVKSLAYFRWGFIELAQILCSFWLLLGKCCTNLYKRFSNSYIRLWWFTSKFGKTSKIGWKQSWSLGLFVNNFASLVMLKNTSHCVGLRRLRWFNWCWFQGKRVQFSTLYSMIISDLLRTLLCLFYSHTELCEKRHVSYIHCF